MTTTLYDAVEHWRQELDQIAETSASDGWQAKELLLAQTRHTIGSYRSHILPQLTSRHPYDVILGDEIRQAVDRLDDLRIDLYSSRSADQEVGELLAALQALARVAARFDETLREMSH